ncbi:TadG family pilus assembly protein [Methylobacterium iners]|uniref:DUF2134 domain-containing protein n=1 Tax=Methylobacterium iners TaxID=418707 RepID=A0ABQ4S071_9HYPH|nr:TadG family pilus assembly protein [Methylobacterium iners]GJD95818.1 hypothetical protein OCOJLMKI_3033 [Methylobacterium iners]
MTGFLSLRSLSRDEGGSFLIIGALSMPILLGVSAFAVDLGNAYYLENRLKIAAEAAALGTVLAIPNNAAAQQKGVDLAAKNVPAYLGVVTRTADVTIGTYEPKTRTFTPSASDQNAVRVVAKVTQENGNALETFFGRFLGKPTLDLTATAIAVRVTPACLIVLDASAGSAFYQQGSAGVALQGCGLHVNSSSGSGLATQGSTSTKAASICVAGGFTGSGYSPVPKIGCAPLADPLAGLPEPSEPVCNQSNVTLNGGMLPSNCTYTGNLVIKGNASLQPGLYYLKGAKLSISGNAGLTGQGVTLFLDATSTLDLGGNGSLSLSAPATGTYAGIAVFQSRSAAPSVTSTLKGTSDFTIDGGIYMPTAKLSVSGSGSVSSPSKVGRVVVGQMELKGSPFFSINAFPNSTHPSGMASGRTALVY